VEPDDPGLQLEAGVEPGELRETDGRGGGESPAKRLKWAGGVFLRRYCRMHPGGCADGLESPPKKQTGDLNFRPPVKLFLRLSLKSRRSFHTASCFVRPHHRHTHFFSP